MNNLKIIKVEQDKNYDNYLVFTLNLPKMLEIITEDIESSIDKANEQCDFKFNYYESYDNIDYNGHFFETVYRDDEKLSHKIKDDNVIITDSFICKLILDDCQTFIKILTNKE